MPHIQRISLWRTARSQPITNVSHKDEAIMVSTPPKVPTPNTNMNHNKNNYSSSILSLQPHPSSLTICQTPQAKAAYRRKSLFGFMVPEAESIMAEKLGSNQQA